MTDDFSDPYQAYRVDAAPKTATRLPVARTQKSRRIRSNYSALQSVTAVTAVALLVGGAALPATANSPEMVSPRTHVFTASPTSVEKKLAYIPYVTPSVPASVVNRDNYEVVYVPPVIPPSPALFNRSDKAFTNDPNGTIQWPLAYGVPLSDGYGPRPSPCEGCSSDHKGQDFDAGTGAPIQAIADGVVTKVEHLPSGLGTYVMIRHQIDGDIIDSVYGHMLVDSPTVQVGDTVKVGQQIGLVGNTGSSTGAHLHFEIHVNGAYVDPFLWMKSHAN